MGDGGFCDFWVTPDVGQDLVICGLEGVVNDIANEGGVEVAGVDDEGAKGIGIVFKRCVCKGFHCAYMIGMVLLDDGKGESTNFP